MGQGLSACYQLQESAFWGEGNICFFSLDGKDGVGDDGRAVFEEAGNDDAGDGVESRDDAGRWFA